MVSRTVCVKVNVFQAVHTTVSTKLTGITVAAARHAARPAAYARVTALPAPPTHLARPGVTKVFASLLQKPIGGGN